jgi:flagellar biosynthesis protein FliR
MMQDVIELSQVYLFFLFFIRISGIFVTAPIFSTRTIPIQIKIIITVFLALIVYQMNYDLHHLYKDIHFLTLASLIVSEIIIGILIGFIANLAFLMVQFGGRLLDIHMGMHIASIMDPLTNEQQSLLGQLQYIIVMLLFLFFNGHHFIILAMLRSFEVIGIGELAFSPLFSTVFIGLLSQAFILGIQIASPIIAILFLIDFCLGVIAKSVPQMNVFLTGMPLKALAGFFMLFLLFIFYGNFFSSVPNLMFEQIVSILRVV